MRPCLFTDGNATLQLTLWGDFVSLVKEDSLLQLTSLSSKVTEDKICLATTYSSAICYLTTSLDVQFPLDDTSEFERNNIEVTKSPVIASVKLDSYLSCKSCLKRVVVTHGTGMVHCMQCNRDYLYSYLKSSPGLFKVIILVELNSPNITVKNESLPT